MKSETMKRKGNVSDALVLPLAFMTMAFFLYIIISGLVTERIPPTGGWTYEIGDIVFHRSDGNRGIILNHTNMQPFLGATPKPREIYEVVFPSANGYQIHHCTIRELQALNDVPSVNLSIDQKKALGEIFAATRAGGEP